MRLYSDPMDGEFVFGDNIYIDDYYMGEKWAPIEHFPGYFVSDKGRVWSCLTNRFLKLKNLDDHGHLGVCLNVNGSTHYKYIHRLVAEAFMPNPDNHSIVRHLNDNPQWNTVEDLAWGTQFDNAQDCIRNGHHHAITDEERRKGNLDRMMPIVAVNEQTGEIQEYESQNYAARCLNIPQANIWKVLHDERPRARGYKFYFKEDFDNG